MKRMAILTGGGDAPGLNACIRAIVKTTNQGDRWEILGIKDGFEGFLSQNGISPLTNQEVRGILPRGGTILGVANRGNPFAHKVFRDGKTFIEDESQHLIASVRSLHLDALVVIGGIGTLRIARELFDLGVPVIGVPKSINNDINHTEFSFGFDTGVTTATEAIDRLHTTAESHHRVMVVELMGRDTGFIALHAGLAGGADIILIPEIPFRYNSILTKVRKRIDGGAFFSIITAAEGARPIHQSAAEESLYSPQKPAPYQAGIADAISRYLSEKHGIDSRSTVLGQLLRGGSPTPFDRWLATRFGSAAARLAEEGKFGRMVALQGEKIVEVRLEDALQSPKQVDVNADTIKTARSLSICFGDD